MEHRGCSDIVFPGSSDNLFTPLRAAAAPVQSVHQRRLIALTLPGARSPSIQLRPIYHILLNIARAFRASP